jgi:hypothetical protein
MNFYIAIIFFCMNGECSFAKDPTNYYNQVDCEKQVIAVIQALNSRAIVNDGACLLIQPEQT